ncbi:hypothetical protein VTN00DRAFT_9203 [Thermoascus crustaceus]
MPLSQENRLQMAISASKDKKKHAPTAINCKLLKKKFF